MINNEMREVYLITYKDEVDDYGQSMVGKKKKQVISMMTKPYKHSTVEDPRYTDIELIGLTKDNLSIDNRIEIDNELYSVSFIDKGRLSAVYLKRL